MIELNFTLVVFSVSFLVFVGLMNIIFFKPVSAVIEKRENTLNSDKTQREKLHKEIEQRLKDYEANLAKSKAKAAHVLEEAQEAATKEKETMMAATVKELNEEKTKEYASLDKEKEAIFKELREPIKEITSLLVSRVLDQDTKVSLSDDQIHSKLSSESRKEELAV